MVNELFSAVILSEFIQLLLHKNDEISVFGILNKRRHIVWTLTIQYGTTYNGRCFYFTNYPIHLELSWVGGAPSPPKLGGQLSPPWLPGA